MEKLHLVAMFFSGLDSKLRRANWEVGARGPGEGWRMGTFVRPPSRLARVTVKLSICKSTCSSGRAAVGNLPLDLVDEVTPKQKRRGRT